jgi:hypothetical protein
MIQKWMDAMLLLLLLFLVRLDHLLPKILALQALQNAEDD